MHKHKSSEINYFAAAVLLCTFIAVPEKSQASDNHGGHGFAETRLTAFTGTDGENLQFIQRIRPSLQMQLSERATLVMTVEAGLAQGRDAGCELRRIIEESDFGLALEEAGCYWPDRGHNHFRIHDSGDYLDVDRLYVDIYRESFDLRIGRQSLNWGSALFFNPTDPFPEILLAEPWRPRRGINSARATLPFGSMNDLMMVIATDDALETASYAGRIRFNPGGISMALTGAWRGEHQNGFLGLDLRGTHLVGWWIESAYYPSGNYPELAAGMDYSFPVLDRFVLFAQYYHNGAGATRPDDYNRPLIQDNSYLPVCGAGIPFTGTFDNPGNFENNSDRANPSGFTSARDYLLLGARLQFNPDISLDAFLLQNLNDGTAMAVPTISIVAARRLDLSISAQIPFKTHGKGGEFRPRIQDLQIEVPNQGTSENMMLDLSELVPSSTISLWARFSF